MMDKPKLGKDQVQILLENKYLSVLDLQYNNTKHYFSATRRGAERTAALLADDEFRSMQPDAVTCVVIVKDSDEYGLLFTKEFRYPVGQYLLSPPAGLLDERDLSEPEPVLSAARREIREETGLCLSDSDKLFVISPLFFSTPGMTDECNAMACAIAQLPEGFEFNSGGTESVEMIGDYRIYSREEVLQMLRTCRDMEGYYYSVYTWAAMMYFISGMWKDKL